LRPPGSQVAKQAGLRPSAIRYYEEIGILSPAERVGGQRRYDNTVLYRLTIVQRARQMGFSLEEIQVLFSGFDTKVPASDRWQQLSKKKLEELTRHMEEIQLMKGLLQEMVENCKCDTLDTCGKGLFKQIPNSTKCC
jgi:MerR family transcriptional regulator, redox-sensitive transcriptional activator SoxR